MAKTLLQINVNYTGPLDDFKAGWMHAAGPISKQPGLIWKIWIYNEDRNEAGGWYLFDSLEHAQGYLGGDLVAAFKANPTLSNISTKIFDIGEEPTAITHGPIREAVNA